MVLVEHEEGQPFADVSIAVFDGWRVDVRALPNPGYEGDPGSAVPAESQVVTVIQDYFTEGFAWTTASPEALVTMLTLRIDERDVVIYVEAPADDAETSIAEAIDILATLSPL